MNHNRLSVIPFSIQNLEVTADTQYGGNRGGSHTRLGSQRDARAYEIH